MEVVGYWLLVNDHSPTPNNPKPQVPTTYNGQKVPTNYKQPEREYLWFGLDQWDKHLVSDIVKKVAPVIPAAVTD
ncbi:hypothetical protein BpHYR1_002129 [Brachionus plicatilis]|uniref:Uncharacterized protein n=1 Tax=Brachionus plicatilis TaxID=10195 RepID=A0A3M7RWV7_BRAPC|nr:hypothetical protein BpHYR1_002129 [Brachionus plicatilis]